MRLGMIVRADQGGLAALTWEAWRYLLPERTLVIDLGGRGRGRSRLDRYPGAWVSEGMDSDLPERLVRRLCREVDVLWTAETFYRSDVCTIARDEACATVLLAMPELWRADMDQPDAVWAPTSWRTDVLPAGTPVVPAPVATDRLPFRRREECRRFLHQAAPAFCDRNGTHLVLDALPHVRSACQVTIAGAGVTGPARIGRVAVTWDNTETENYWDRFVGPDAADALLLPRRFGGLCLPMQQAFAVGMPVVTLDLDPQRAWVAPELRVPATVERRVPMGGGTFPVHTADPAAIARAIDRLVDDPGLCAAESDQGVAHARSISWTTWAGRYRTRLEEAVAGVSR